MIQLFKYSIAQRTIHNQQNQSQQDQQENQTEAETTSQTPQEDERDFEIQMEEIHEIEEEAESEVNVCYSNPDILESKVSEDKAIKSQLNEASLIDSLVEIPAASSKVSLLSPHSTQSKSQLIRSQLSFRLPEPVPFHEMLDNRTLASPTVPMCWITEPRESQTIQCNKDKKQS